jgi:hypothetical protein
MGWVLGSGRKVIISGRYLRFASATGQCAAQDRGSSQYQPMIETAESRDLMFLADIRWKSRAA